MSLASKYTRRGPWILITLILLGLALQGLDLIEWRQLLDWGQARRDNPWLILLLIASQVLLFTFALPGSSVLWLTAPLYTPLAATLILTTGATLGALAAYLFARHIGRSWQTSITQHPSFRLLQTRGDFLSLLTLRLLPGFPHSVINYGAGILSLPLTGFLFSTALGISLKAVLYTSAISSAVAANRPADLLDSKTLLPLLILAALAIMARLAQHWLTRTSSH